MSFAPAIVKQVPTVLHPDGNPLLTFDAVHLSLFVFGAAVVVVVVVAAVVVVVVAAVVVAAVVPAAVVVEAEAKAPPSVAAAVTTINVPEGTPLTVKLLVKRPEFATAVIDVGDIDPVEELIAKFTV